MEWRPKNKEGSKAVGEVCVQKDEVASDAKVTKAIVDPVASAQTHEDPSAASKFQGDTGQGAQWQVAKGKQRQPMSLGASRPESCGVSLGLRFQALEEMDVSLSRFAGPVEVKAMAEDQLRDIFNPLISFLIT
ncbi:hypothetical protein Dimus_019014 [Dionaea muscipula]